MIDMEDYQQLKMPYLLVDYDNVRDGRKIDARRHLMRPAERERWPESFTLCSKQVKDMQLRCRVTLRTAVNVIDCPMCAKIARPFYKAEKQELSDVVEVVDIEEGSNSHQ